MATFIDFSFAVDAAREKRVRTERAAEAERVDAEIAAEEQRRANEVAFRRQGLNELHRSTLGIGKSLPSTSSATAFVATGISHTTAEQVPVLPRLGRRQRAREFLRPGLRKKRVAEEFAVAQLITPEIEQPVETSSLPGASLLELQARKEKPLPISPIEEGFDADMTRGSDDDDEITALPPLPGYRYQYPAYLSSSEEHSDLPSVECLADQAMDDAEAAYDAPGNRSSVRLPLPAEWMATRRESSRAVGMGGSGPPLPPAYAAFTPLPDMSLPGPPLPDGLE
ncbi:hypothetical protein N0V95_002772 [Ascochyta clinopodiicola]|nr:hypothetical protein N0V95_002772 [Ascochyta clinopodiicola]